MKEMKAIIQYLAAIAKRKAGECKGDGCYGRGCIYPNFTRPCPDCADLRRVAEMCWHEVKAVPQGYECSCGAICRSWLHRALHLRNYNPTLTIPEVRSYMEIVGMWEEFIVYLYDNLDTLWGMSDVRNYRKFADILTSDKFYTVAEEFLKGEVNK